MASSVYGKRKPLPIELPPDHPLKRQTVHSSSSSSDAQSAIANSSSFFSTASSLSSERVSLDLADGPSAGSRKRKGSFEEETRSPTETGSDAPAESLDSRPDFFDPTSQQNLRAALQLVSPLKLSPMQDTLAQGEVSPLELSPILEATQPLSDNEESPKPQPEAAPISAQPLRPVFGPLQRSEPRKEETFGNFDLNEQPVLIFGQNQSSSSSSVSQTSLSFMRN